ncbi:hypothetical protein [Acetomicrobium sp. S15 = DSM 107314]|nr:hypothetical protein [Acetomicrobium sp. S15 = DSM 107314]
MKTIVHRALRNSIQTFGDNTGLYCCPWTNREASNFNPGGTVSKLL